MPIYEYKAEKDGCERCSERLEVFQDMSDDPLEECPHCGAPVEKLLSTFGAKGEDMLSNSNLKEHGFHKLRKTRDGNYEKEV